MQNQGLEFQRISLGALIIALGMLVDNAIVVTEGILIGLKRGLTRLESANAIVRQTMWPLLGATVMFGLGFATILTLIIVPVLNTMVYRIPYRSQPGSALDG